MKDTPARVLAIIALVTMGLFVAALIATLVDYTLLNGAVGFIALGFGIFTLMIFIALKADGRGFSMNKINNEIEMKKIEDELAKREQAKKEKDDCVARENDSVETTENTSADGSALNGEYSENSPQEKGADGD